MHRNNLTFKRLGIRIGQMQPEKEALLILKIKCLDNTQPGIRDYIMCGLLTAIPSMFAILKDIIL